MVFTLIPLLDKKTANSILIGDYIGEPRNSAFLKELLFTYLVAHREIKYVHHGLFFIVYLNNLSEKNFQDIDEGLKKLSAYNGYFDLTYASPIKTVLSTILVRAFLKSKTTIINPTEADEDVNMTSYPFEKFGYRVIGIDDLTYGVYLSYKIEREVFPGYEADQLFSLNALTDEVKDLSELTPALDERKLEYLLQKKFGTLSIAGITKLTTSQIVDILLGATFRT